MGASGCSREKRTLGEIRSAYAREDYRETIALCRHAIRRNMGSGRVYYYYGAALAHLNRDYEAARQLRQATTRDPSLAVEAGRLFYGLGVSDARAGKTARAADRLGRAAELDPGTALGRFAFLVGDRNFESEKYVAATRWYREAIAAYPDSSACERAYLRLADSLINTGASGGAREALQTLLNRYPNSIYRRQARWKLATMTYAEAENRFAVGDYEASINLLTKIPEWTANRALLQKQRFLLGETYEAMGEFDHAFSQYRMVIHEDRGASGAIVLRAKEKLDALREAGIQ